MKCLRLHSLFCPHGLFLVNVVYFFLVCRPKCPLRLSGSLSVRLWPAVANEAMAMATSTTTMLTMITLVVVVARPSRGTPCASRAKRPSLCGHCDLCRWMRACVNKEKRGGLARGDRMSELSKKMGKLELQGVREDKTRG